MPRFYVGYSSGEKEVWKASNVAAEANFLVTVELSFAGDDPRSADRYKAALVALGKDATQRRQLSRYAWGFRLDSRLNEVFQTLVDHLGVESVAGAAPVRLVDEVSFRLDLGVTLAIVG